MDNYTYEIPISVQYGIDVDHENKFLLSKGGVYEFDVEVIIIHFIIYIFISLFFETLTLETLLGNFNFW